MSGDIPYHEIRGSVEIVTRVGPGVEHRPHESHHPAALRHGGDHYRRGGRAHLPTRLCLCNSQGLRRSGEIG